MPPLRLFGRSWHISSDDLALPGVIGVLFHGTWSILIIAQVAVIGLPNDCPQRSWASSSILWLLASFVLTTALQVWVTAASLRGGMLEEHKRASVPTAMYCLLAAYCLEAAALTYTTVVYKSLVGTADACYTAEELARTAVHDLAMHRWFIVTTWVILAVVGALLVLLYNLYPDRGLDAWVDRVHCLSYVLCCWRSLGATDSPDGSFNAATPTVLRLAKVFGDVFYPLNFSFTDIVAAITLVGITHRTRAHRPGGASHSHALIAAAGAGLFGHGKQQGYRNALEILQTAEAAGSGRSVQGTGETATAAVDFGVQAVGDLTGLDLAGQQEQQEAAATAGLRKSRSHQQLLKLLLDLEADKEEIQQQHNAAAASASSTNGSHSNGQSDYFNGRLHPRSPLASVLNPFKHAAASTTHVSSLRRSSSDGAVSGKSSMAGAVAAPVPDTRASRASSMSAALAPAAGAAAGSALGNSLWEQAVRQASAMAVAPGYGLKPGSRQGSATAPNPEGVGPVPYPSTSVGSASQRSQGSAPWTNPEGLPASRAQSWADTVRSDVKGSGLETLVSGVATPASAPLLSSAGSSSSSCQGLAARVQPCASAVGRQAQASSGAVQGSNVSSRLGIQQHASLEPPLQPQLLPAGSSSGSISSSIPNSCSRPPLPAPGAQELCAAAEAAEVAADSLVAGLQAAATTAAARGGAAAAPDLAAAVEAAEDDFNAAVLSDGSSVSLELLEEALHWHRYANAIYGWPMFLWSHRYRMLRCCQLCCGGCYNCAQRTAELHGRTSSSASLGMETDGLSEADAAAGPADTSLRRAASNKAAQQQAAAVGSAVGVQRTTPLSETALQPAARGGIAGAAATKLGAGPLGEAAEGPEEVFAAAAAGASAAAKHAGGAAGAMPVLHLGANQSNQQLQSGHRQQHHALRQQQQCSQPVSSTSVGYSSSASWDVEEGGSSFPGSSAPAAGTRLKNSTTSQQPAINSIAAAPAAGSSTVRHLHASSAGAIASSKSVRGPGVGAGTLRGDSSCCCGGCFGGDWGASHVPKMEPLTASQRLTREAIVQTTRIPEAALLHVNYANLVEGLLPYSVAIDEGRRCVVLAIRGSLSVEDCVTDVLYDPAPLDEDWLMQQAPAWQAPPAPLSADIAASRAMDAAAAAAAHATASPSADALPLAVQPAEVPGVSGGASSAAANAAGKPEQQLTSGSSLLSCSSSQRMSPFATAAVAAAAAAASPADDCSSEALEQRSTAGAAAGRDELQQRPSVPIAQSMAAAAAAAAASQQQGPMQYQQPSSLPQHVARNESVVRRQQQEVQRIADSSATSGSRLLQPLLSLQTSWRQRTTEAPLLPTTVSLRHAAGSTHCSTTGTTAAESAAAAGSTAGALVNAYSRPSTRPASRSQLGESFSLNYTPRRSSSRVSGSQLLGQPQLSQVQRTTAADRALGAARARHKYAPVTCSATDPAAVAAAAEQRSWQQKQQHLHIGADHSSSVTGLPAALSVPAGARSVSASAAGGAARLHGSSAAALGHLSSHRAVSVSCAEVSRLQQQQPGQQRLLLQQGPVSAAAAAAGPYKFTEAGSGPSNQQHQQLRATWSEFGLLGRTQLTQQQQELQWEQHMQGSVAGYTGDTLQDGGPTDAALLSKACTMTPSRTAAVQHPVVSAKADAAKATGAAAGPAAAAVADVSESLQSPFVQYQQPAADVLPPSAGRAQAVQYSSTAGAAAGGDGWLPALQSCTAQLDDSAVTPASDDTEQGQQLGTLTKQEQQRVTDDPQQQQQQQDVLASLAAAEAAVAAASAEAEDDAAAAAAQAAAAEETPDTGAAGAQWFAHEGILNCARAIRDDLRSLGLLEQLLLGSGHAQQQQQQQQDISGSTSMGVSGSVGAAAEFAGLADGSIIGSTAGAPLDASSASAPAAAAAGRVPAAAAAAHAAKDLPDCRGWTLVLTGHSLGAGVAALLALHYRCIFPRVRVWCFGPPGGLMSPAAAASLKDICYSLVSAKDMVPRMSLWTIERLRDEMMLCALRCKMPKLKLLLGAALGRDWEEAEVLLPPEALTDAQAARYRAYRRAVEQERCMDPLRVRIAREFVPPGEIIWLERYKVVKQRLRAPAAAGTAVAGSALPLVPDTGSSVAMPAATSVAADPAAATAAAAAAAGAQAGSSSSSSAPAAAASMLRAGSRGLAAAIAAAPSAVAGKRIALYLRPHFTDGLSLIVGGMVVSRNMFLDHVPDNQLAQLKRLVRRLQRQRAVRIGLTAAGNEAVAGSATQTAAARVGRGWRGAASVDVPPKQQAMPGRQHAVHFAV